MKAVRNVFLLTIVLFILPTQILQSQIRDKDQASLIKPEVELTDDIFWQVKAYHPEAKLLRIKAIDIEGNIFDVKAIQESDDTSILNVKALIDGQRLPIKLIVKNNDRYYPVKAIDPQGRIIDIKALTEEGEKLDVKGVSKSGNIVHLRAITKENVFYNIVAVSPFGDVNTVKGIKMMDEEVEAVIYGVEIFAHVKAIKQN